MDTQETGSPPYKGYAYQILSTVWAAVDLIIHRKLCDAVEIEPASHEDVAAQLDVSPEHAEARMTASGGAVRLQIQIKKSSTPWSATSIRKLISPRNKPSKRGPRPRARPVEMLRSDPALLYALITDAQIQPNLSVHRVDLLGHVTQRSNVLGPQFHDVCDRITVLERKTEPLLIAEIERMLTTSAHVPISRASECRLALEREVHDRMLGKTARAWAKGALDNEIRKFGGHPQPTKEMSSFIPPSNYKQIVERLDRDHAVILVGPPGIGKTLCAGVVAHGHRTTQPPYEVIRVQGGPTQVRANLDRDGPIVFYLEDPWGQTKVGDEADQWTRELPRILLDARDDKRFIVTSRTTILAAAGGFDEHGLGAYVHRIEAEHFTPEDLWRILDNALHEAQWQRDWTEYRRSDILEALSMPYSFRVFAQRLLRIDAPAHADLDQLLRESRVEAIGSAVCEELGTAKWVTSAIALWALVATGKGASPDEATFLSTELSRASGELVNVTALLEYMREGGWANIDDLEYRVHPTVIEGLEKLVQREVVRTQLVVANTIEALIRSGQIGRAIRIMSDHHSRKLPIPTNVRAVIEETLLQQMSHCADGDLEQCASVLAKISTATDPISTLVRAALRHSGGSWRLWVAPEWKPDEFAKVAASPEALSVARRLVRVFVPDSRINYDRDFLDFIRQIGWDLSEDFADAARSTLGTPINNLSVVWLGACSAADPNWNELLDRVLTEYKTVDEWWEQYSVGEYTKAKEHELDSAHASHVMDQPAEQFYLVETPLREVVRVRRAREGWKWLVAHPQRSLLLEAWSTSIPEASGVVHQDELREFASTCSINELPHAWRAIARADCTSLLGVILQGLEECPLTQLQACVSELFSMVSAADIEKTLASVIPKLSWPRRAMIVNTNAGIPARDDNYYRDPHAHRAALAAALLSSAEASVLAACDPATDTESLKIDEPGLALLRTLAAGNGGALSAHASNTLSKLGYLERSDAEGLLYDDDPQTRYYAMSSLARAGAHDTAALMKLLRTDTDWQCRKLALEILSECAPEAKRLSIAKIAAADRSFPVREACAKIIGSRRWTESLSCLCDLLSDRHDRNEASGFRDALPECRVARMAALALRRFGAPLEAAIIDRIITFVLKEGNASEDVTVHDHLLKLLSREDGQHVVRVFLALTKSRWRVGSRHDPRYPIRYSAMWAIAYYLYRPRVPIADLDIRPLILAALHTDRRLAAPAQIAVGLLYGRGDPRAHDQVVCSDHLSDEAFVLLAAAGRMRSVRPSASVVARLGSTHPALAIIELAAADPALDDQQWNARLETIEGVDAWRTKLSDETASTGPFRFVIDRLRRRTTMLKGFRTDELPSSPKFISTYSMASPV